MTETERQPAPRLWSWADFKGQLPHLNRRQFMRLSDQCKAPKYLRWTAKAPPLWEPDAVQQWIDDRMAPVTGGADHAAR